MAGLQASGLASGSPSNFFRAKLDDVRYLVTVLKALAYKDKAQCILSPQGLRVITEDSQASQSRGYLEASHFREYNFPDLDRPGDHENDQEAAENSEDQPGTASSITFGIDIQALLDCLTIFGGASAHPSTTATGGDPYDFPTQETRAIPIETSRVPVRITRPLTGGVLSLMLEEREVVTVCQLNTTDPEPISELHSRFIESRVVGKVIMKSEWLRDAFSELDGTSDTLTLIVASVAPYFRLAASGLAGDAQMDYPKDTDVVESFSCLENTRNNYRYASIAPCLRALAFSTKTSIRVNETGFLSLQFMIPLNEKDVTFVEYLVSPLIRNDNDDQNSNDENENQNTAGS
ncbi:Rad1/Rec1/Rad17 [Fimicolochytrium jonesii]|uniref:Rad1/Rec1/Rad17 n=1 Tax=Fimicolochytrium jonesii TaxID=1396493 RepID=UPI0022FF43DA|nr:Rad1/Rec1/Rad17 [Fimicolochytrium jonesii]KAI8819888.1 Rad1/Rec1/Rad17 [Fimicolochytrium jonesii]